MLHVKVGKTALRAQIMRILREHADQGSVIDGPREPISPDKRQPRTESTFGPKLRSVRDGRCTCFKLEDILEIFVGPPFVQRSRRPRSRLVEIDLTPQPSPLLAEVGEAQENVSLDGQFH